jgi:hypothetical protein
MSEFEKSFLLRGTEGSNPSPSSSESSANLSFGEQHSIDDCQYFAERLAQEGHLPLPKDQTISPKEFVATSAVGKPTVHRILDCPRL